jgi:purine-nucleoside phosphorylase
MMELLPEIESKYSGIAQSIDCPFVPDIAVVTGSGFSAIAEQTEVVRRVGYSEIEGLTQSTVEGHDNELIFCHTKGTNICIFSGRLHHYEGRTPVEICSPVILAKFLGAEKMIFFNAAGGINPYFRPGELMLIRDAVSIQFISPAPLFRPETLASLQEIFYTPRCEKLRKSMINNKLQFREGIYCAVAGASYETRAEIRMLRIIGADAVGMSTATEARCAAMLGMRCMGISLITNVLNPAAPRQLTHEEVTDKAAAGSHNAGIAMSCAVEALK